MVEKKQKLKEVKNYSEKKIHCIKTGTRIMEEDTKKGGISCIWSSHLHTFAEITRICRNT